jgi:hypothetical protein
MRLTVLAEGVTNVEYACTMDLKGRFPSWLTNSKIIPNLMALPYMLQGYFAQIRPIDDCTAKDGAFIGHMMMNAALKASKARRAEVVAAFISRTAMLREAPLANLHAILQSMICKDGHNLMASNVATQDLAQLTMADARTIGDGITAIRRSHMVPAKAVAEVLAKYAVLQATAHQCAWPMLATTFARLMAVSTGKKLRLAFSASMSLLDIGTDLWTMLVYLLSKQFLTGLLILAMVCFSIATQALLVFYRNRHRSAGEIAKEMLIVLSFLKPAIDLRRLMDGREVDGAPFDTAAERSYCKAIETVCESIPTSIIAMVALLLSGYWAWAPIVAVFISWIVTAFKTTSLSFDLDIDRATRTKFPSFYGFIPLAPTRQSIVQACLFVLVLAHIVERTTALTLLFVTRAAWLGAWLGTEMGLFLLYKALRSDLIYWIPGMGLGTSITVRVLSKLMLDFCGLPHTRHPCEAGGAYWLFSIVTNQAMCFVSIWAYAAHYDGPGKLDGALLFATFGALTGAWVVALTGFLLSIERTYLWTFASLETGREYAIRVFRETEGSDQRRVDHIFNTNEQLWASIREEVAKWSQANFRRWLAEQPEWLTPGLLDKIPDDCIPKLRFVYEPALVRRHKGVRGLDGDLH